MFNKLFLFVGNGAEVEKLKHIDLLLLLISNNHLYRPNYLKKKAFQKTTFCINLCRIGFNCRVNFHQCNIGKTRLAIFRWCNAQQENFSRR